MRPCRACRTFKPPVLVTLSTVQRSPFFTQSVPVIRSCRSFWRVMITSPALASQVAALSAVAVLAQEFAARSAWSAAPRRPSPAQSPSRGRREDRGTSSLRSSYPARPRFAAVGVGHAAISSMFVWIVRCSYVYQAAAGAAGSDSAAVVGRGRLL